MGVQTIRAFWRTWNLLATFREFLENVMIYYSWRAFKRPSNDELLFWIASITPCRKSAISTGSWKEFICWIFLGRCSKDSPKFIEVPSTYLVD